MKKTRRCKRVSREKTYPVSHTSRTVQEGSMTRFTLGFASRFEHFKVGHFLWRWARIIRARMAWRPTKSHPYEGCGAQQKKQNVSTPQVGDGCWAFDAIGGVRLARSFTSGFIGANHLVWRQDSLRYWPTKVNRTFWRCVAPHRGTVVGVP